MPENAVTPQTTEYLLLGIGVVTLMLLGFAGWVALRFRSLHQDIATLEMLQEEE
jgi:hypothetical protein